MERYNPQFFVIYDIYIPSIYIYIVFQTGYRPGAARRYVPRKSSTNKDLRQSRDPKIAADLRPSANGSAVRTSLVAGGG